MKRMRSFRQMLQRVLGIHRLGVKETLSAAAAKLDELVDEIIQIEKERDQFKEMVTKLEEINIKNSDVEMNKLPPHLLDLFTFNSSRPKVAPQGRRIRK